MDKLAEYLEEVYEDAFNDEMNKIAGVVSEGVGSVGWFPLPSAVGGLIGANKGGYKTEKDLKRADAKSFSNVLLPGVGGYRLARRLSTTSKIRDAVLDDD